MDNVNTMSTNKKSWFFEDGKPVSRNMFIITGTVVILIRLLLTTIPSYQVDMGGYRAWSLYLAENGSGRFL